MVGDAAVGEVEPVEDRMVELPALVVVADPIDLDRSEGLAEFVGGDIARGELGYRVGDLLVADGSVVASAMATLTYGAGQLPCWRLRQKK